MTLDIRGSLKNTRKSKNALVVVDELIANSVDAFLIRRATTQGDLNLEIKFSVRAQKSDLLGHEYDLEIECVDNGCGLGPDQLKAFLTKDTSYKDDLNIPGIGNCKGAGRVQFFHHFSKLSLLSMYLEDGKKNRVHLPAEENRKEIEETDFEILSNIIKNHLASNGYYLDVDSLMHGIGLKEIVDVIDDKIMSLIDLLERKGLTTYQE